MTDKTAAKETQTPAKETKTAVKADVATYDTDAKAKTLKVRAADGTQMYDPVSQKLYTDDKGGHEARENDQFVVTNLNRGKLKKVS